MENNQKNQLNIEISDEVAEGKYSNLAIITHSPNEFIVGLTFNKNYLTLPFPGWPLQPSWQQVPPGRPDSTS